MERHVHCASLCIPTDHLEARKLSVWQAIFQPSHHSSACHNQWAFVCLINSKTLNSKPESYYLLEGPHAARADEKQICHKWQAHTQQAPQGKFVCDCQKCVGSSNNIESKVLPLSQTSKQMWQIWKTATLLIRISFYTVKLWEAPRELCTKECLDGSKKVINYSFFRTRFQLFLWSIFVLFPQLKSRTCHVCILSSSLAGKLPSSDFIQYILLSTLQSKVYLISYWRLEPNQLCRILFFKRLNSQVLCL